MKNFIVAKAKEASHGFNACIKQSVYAMITTSEGHQIFGSNKMLNNVSVCPRDVAGCVSGQGYHMCKEICNQIAHAEVDAINFAKENGIFLIGSTLQLVGHTYCCENCITNMKKEGIVSVEIICEDTSVFMDLTANPVSLL